MSLNRDVCHRCRMGRHKRVFDTVYGRVADRVEADFRAEWDRQGIVSCHKTSSLSKEEYLDIATASAPEECEFRLEQLVSENGRNLKESGDTRTDESL